MKKGLSRPIDTSRIRKEKLLETGLVNIVFINGEKTPLGLIKQIRPQIIFVGDDYSEKTTVGAEEIKAWGGEVKIIKRIGGISTTKILKDRKNG